MTAPAMETERVRAELIARARSIIDEGALVPLGDSRALAEKVVDALVGDVHTFCRRVRYRTALQAAETVDSDQPDAAAYLRTFAVLIAHPAARPDNVVPISAGGR